MGVGIDTIGRENPNSAWEFRRVKGGVRIGAIDQARYVGRFRKMFSGVVGVISLQT